MNGIKGDYFEFSEGEIQISIQNETSIHLRCATKEGDPVELSSEEARELADRLLQLANRIE